MGVVHSLTLQIVRGDQVEPEVDHGRQLGEYGKAAAEAIDRRSGLGGRPTEAVDGHRTCRDTPKLKEHLACDRKAVARETQPRHFRYRGGMFQGGAVRQVDEDIRVEEAVSHLSYIESRWVASTGRGGLGGRLATHS